MHVNDVYALRSLLRDVQAGRAVSKRMVAALLEAAEEELNQFEDHLEYEALMEEARSQGVEV